MGMLVAVFAATSAGAAKFITGGDIKNGSIGLKDLSAAAKRALKGKSGPAGPEGPAGAQGPAGPSSLSTTVRFGSFTAPANDFADGEVRCPAGMVAVGGSVSPGVLIPVIDGPSVDGSGWVGSAIDITGDPGNRMLVSAICTPGSAQVSGLTSMHDRAELKADARTEHAG
ncbi:MAG TPA: hypothetical protein VF250_09525 [Conexibacter sp.]